MADCIQVVNGKVRPSLRYQAPRRAAGWGRNGSHDHHLCPGGGSTPLTSVAYPRFNRQQENPMATPKKKPVAKAKLQEQLLPLLHAAGDGRKVHLDGTITPSLADALAAWGADLTDNEDGHDAEAEDHW
jgi:hypothetical protein